MIQVCDKNKRWFKKGFLEGMLRTWLGDVNSENACWLAGHMFDKYESGGVSCKNVYTKAFLLAFEHFDELESHWRGQTALQWLIENKLVNWKNAKWEN